MVFSVLYHTLLNVTRGTIHFIEYERELREIASAFKKEGYRVVCTCKYPVRIGGYYDRALEKSGALLDPTYVPNPSTDLTVLENILYYNVNTKHYNLVGYKDTDPTEQGIGCKREYKVFKDGEEVTEKVNWKDLMRPSYFNKSHSATSDINYRMFTVDNIVSFK